MHGGKGHGDAERKCQSQIKLRQREKAFGKGICDGQKQGRKAHQPGKAVERHQTQGRHQTQHDGQKQRFGFGNQTFGKRAVFGALYCAVKIAVGKVVHDATCAAH